jgi:hypothetical protein
MSASTVTMIIQLLVLIAEAIPKLAPAIQTVFETMKKMFAGESIPDITQEELEARIDAAILQLPEWT